MVAKFGQSMYTSEDYSRTDLITDDRLYAGLLYIGLSWNRCRQDAITAKVTEILDMRDITLGVNRIRILNLFLDRLRRYARVRLRIMHLRNRQD